LEAIEALELIQIDHTLADVMIVDSLYRASIGRPWLSLAIDVATRSVLGFHLGLEIPSALAVALCIEHAVLPTLPSAAASITDTSWDMFGMRKHILVDNWSEFHGETLTRGSAEYGIALTYRPVARPRFGAHIERLIGTMIGKAQISRNGDFTKSDSTGGSNLKARPSQRQQKSEKYVALSSSGIWPVPYRCRAHWPEMIQWLEEHPDQTAVELLTEFQARNQGFYCRHHLRTLRRRVQVWRREAIQWGEYCGLQPPKVSVAVTSVVKHPVTNLREAIRGSSSFGTIFTSFATIPNGRSRDLPMPPRKMVRRYLQRRHSRRKLLAESGSLQFFFSGARKHDRALDVPTCRAFLRLSGIRK